MPFFDASDYSDPATMALLGMASGFGQAAMPSRMPVPLGAAMGMGAGGLAQGIAQGSQLRQRQSQTSGQDIQNAMQGLNLKGFEGMSSFSPPKAPVNFFGGLNGAASQNAPSSSPTNAPISAQPLPAPGAPASGNASGSSTTSAQPSGSSPSAPGSYNFGNIKASPDNNWVGQVPSKSQFAAFDSPQNGVRAVASLLHTYGTEGVNTIDGIVNRWAPPSENPTPNLVANAILRTGYKPGQPLDMSDPATLTNLTRAMIQQEQGRLPVSNDVISQGVTSALHPQAQQGTMVADASGGTVGGGTSPQGQPQPQQTAPGAAPAMDVQGLVDAYNQYRSFPAGMPIAQQLLGAIMKAQPEGYTLMQDGSLQPRQGGPADPAVMQGQSLAQALGKNEQTVGPNGQVGFLPGVVASNAQNAAAEGWAKAGPAAWQASMAPRTLRGPGSVYVDPYDGQTVQIPNEINSFDPKTGAEYKRFVPLGLNVTGNGPLSAAVGGAPGTPTQGAPAAAGAQQTPLGAAPPAGAPAGAPGASGAPGAIPGQPNESGTTFMTGLPPGQREMMEGAAKNYADEGKKTYQAAVAGMGSLAFIDRDIDQMGPQGWMAMGEGANDRAGLAKTINSMASVAGIQPPFDQSKIASWEDFRKETTLLGMKGLAALFGGSREAASIVTTSIGAVPNPENSFVGAKLLTNAYKEGFQREIDLRNYETNWAGAHGGNLVGAQESFNQQYAPQAYTFRAVSKVQPYTVNSPADLKRFLPGTYVKTPDGQTRMVPGQGAVPLSQQYQPNG